MYISADEMLSSLSFLKIFDIQAMLGSHCIYAGRRMRIQYVLYTCGMALLLNMILNARIESVEIS